MLVLAPKLNSEIEENIPKRVGELKVGGKIKRRTPKQTWEKTLTRDLKGLGIEEQRLKDRIGGRLVMSGPSKVTTGWHLAKSSKI